MKQIKIVKNNMLHIITENSELKGRKFPIPDGVRNFLQKTLDNYKGDKTIEGYKRLNNILSMNGIAYNEMKRIKNFFDKYQGSDKSAEFILNGGEPMKNWVNNTLYTATKAVHDFKQAKKDAGVSNAFIRHHTKDRQNKRKNKPTQAKFDTKNINRKMLDGDTLRYESVLRESVDWEDYIYDYSPYYVLENFWDTRDGKQNWGVLINPSMYQKALDEFTKYGKLTSFPTKYIYQWIGIIIKNSLILDSNTALAGHKSYFPTDDFIEFIENHFPEKLDEIDEIEEFDFLDELGLYDWMTMPDGSDAWSDFGLEPIFKLLHQYNNNSTPEQTLVLINKVLDVYHQRGDLSSIFIQGGTKSLSQITNGSMYENKKRKTIIITEKQKRMLTEAMDDTFSLEELSNLPSFNKRLNYCKKHLGFNIGKGSSRITFQVDDEKVLKLAFNEKGVAQNSEESRAYGDDIFPQVFDSDPNDYWIVSEFVLPAKAKDFKHCFGMTFKQFCSFLYASSWLRFGNKRHSWLAMKQEQWENLMENNEDLAAFDDYIGNYGDIVVGDMTRICNYGLTQRDGEPHIVLLDSGLTEDVWNTHYKPKPRFKVWQ